MTGLDSYEAHAQKMMWGPSERLHQWVAGRALRTFGGAGDLLEVGTGSGRIARAALAQGWRYTGVEPTHLFAEATRSVDPSIVVYEESLPDLPVELKDAFDAVVTMHVIEHAATPQEAREWAAALASCLRSGGRLLTIAPDVRDHRTAFWDCDWSHGWPTTPVRIGQLLEDIGLTVTTAKTMRLGSISPWSSLGTLSAILPTKPTDAISQRLVGRPLGTGVKIAAFWGLSFVVARKN